MNRPASRLALPRLATLGLVVAVLAGCAPRLSPPYRDYEVRAELAADALTRQLDAAAVEAGWTTVASEDPRVISTTARSVSQGLLSRTSAALDLVPLDGGFVRVYVWAEKRSILGGRSKVFALNGSLRESVLGSITQALASRGLVALDAPRERDEDATD